MIKKIKDWISPKAEVRESFSKGKGLFAKEIIKEGEKVVVWNSYYTNKTEAKNAKTTGKIVMQWDEDLYSIEDKGEDLGYFINHSCDSNLWMQDMYTLVAKKDVNPGEELTADYALWEADEEHVSPWNCNCGSPLCRKKVTGKDWQNPIIQNRYLNHFSPLINKRIANSK